MSRIIRTASLLAALTTPATVQAQVPAISGTLKPSAGAPAGPSYGVQPYDPTNSTGFNHPNQQGYGTYQNPTKLTGPRAGALKYRRFKGY